MDIITFIMICCVPLLLITCKQQDKEITRLRNLLDEVCKDYDELVRSVKQDAN